MKTVAVSGGFDPLTRGHIEFLSKARKLGDRLVVILNKDELKREFAQVLTLFLQLANHYKIDLEKAFEAELEITKKRFNK